MRKIRIICDLQQCTKEFLSLDDSEYKKRIQMTSNVNNLIYNAWLSNSYFSKMEVYSDKRISNNDAVFKKASDLEDNSWYEASWNSADTLWWNENGKYFITRRIAMSLPNRVYGVLRAEVKEKFFLTVYPCSRKCQWTSR